MTNQNEDVIEITKEEADAYEENKALKNDMLKLLNNKQFKTFQKYFIDKSLVQLGLNLGVSPQSRGDISLQIEARRIFNEFIEQVIRQGVDAEEVLNGVE